MQYVVHLNNLNKIMKVKDIKSILNLTHPPFLPQHRATSFKILRAPKVEFFWQDVFRFFLFFKALSTSDRSLLIATEFFKGNVCQIFVQKSCFSARRRFFLFSSSDERSRDFGVFLLQRICFKASKSTWSTFLRHWSWWSVATFSSGVHIIKRSRVLDSKQKIDYVVPSLI